MSRFFSDKTASIQPYVPGEQPQDKGYIKLNTNECPYPPSPRVLEAVRELDYADLRLYPDPDTGALRKALGEYAGLPVGQVFAGGGSDEVLAYAFMAFFNPGDKVYFADITYGFYQVYADLFSLDARLIPLQEDFTIDPADYYGLDGHMFIANPNAPTGIALEPAQIEEILRRNPDRLVVVDEAYVDFAPGKSVLGLVPKYDNLLVVQTYSKSRALAGMRLGAGYGHAGLIDGLNRIKYSFNPYNLDRVSIAAGIAGVEDTDYFQELTGKIIATRERTVAALKELGFTVTPSETNFLLIRHPCLSGEQLYQQMKDRGILVRYFGKPRISDYVRLTIGADEEMDTFLSIARDLG